MKNDLLLANPALAALETFVDPWDAAEEEVVRLSRYEKNWDGDGADPVSPKLIRSALEFFRMCRLSNEPAPDAIYPLAGGTIMGEWHHENGSVTSVEIRKPGKAEVLIWKTDRTTTFSVIPFGAEGNPVLQVNGEPVSDELCGLGHDCFSLAA